MSASANPDSSSGGEAGRVRCLYCGANNFPSSPACWQCARPLKALPAQASLSGAGPAAPSAGAAFQAGTRPATASPTDPALATKAAAALGLMFPYIGLPVGMVFLMLDDARKIHLGWVTIGWSIAGSVLNGIFLIATLGPTLAMLKSMLPPTQGHGGGLPGLPGLPPSGGGDPENLNLIIPHLRLTFASLFAHLGL